LHFKVDELTEKNKLDVDATLRDVYRKVQKNFNNKSSKVSINNSIAAIDKKRLINKMRNK
jgi:chromosome condensin MukBEF complex kleisin-like MukF subunit